MTARTDASTMSCEVMSRLRKAMNEGIVQDTPAPGLRSMLKLDSDGIAVVICCRPVVNAIPSSGMSE